MRLCCWQSEVVINVIGNFRSIPKKIGPCPTVKTIFFADTVQSKRSSIPKNGITPIGQMGIRTSRKNFSIPEVIQETFPWINQNAIDDAFFLFTANQDELFEAVFFLQSLQTLEVLLRYFG